MFMLDVISLVALAFFLEMIDNGLGGGFGTILSPLLVILGYDVKVVVPAILFSEMISGVWGGAWHIKYKNVNYRSVAYTLAGSLVGMTLATFLIGFILPASIAKLYIGVIALAMGVFVTVRSFSFINKHATIQQRPSGWKTTLLGLVAGFNKGGTGGGYGPLSVSGYMLLGLSAAAAIGTTTIAEGIASLLGLALYVSLSGIILSIAIPLAAGAFIADPISAWFNNYLKVKLSPPYHGRIIGLTMSTLGVITLMKTLGFI